MAEQEVCTICLNDYQQAVVKLDCNHSFCFICLEDYVNKTSTNDHFPCPLCRVESSLPEGGVKELKPKVNTNIPQCDVCINSLSKFSCKDCQQYLCDSCKTTHGKLKGCKDHIVVRYEALLTFSTESGANNSVTEDVKYESSPRDVCPNHQHTSVKFYCKDCSMAVCSDCYVIDHNGHQFLNLHDDRVREEINGELKTLNEEIKTHIDQLENFSESLNLKYSEVNDSVKTECDKIDEQVDRICREVRELGNQMKQQMKTSCDEDVYDDVDGKLKKLMEDIKRQTEDLKASVKYSVNVLEESSIVQVLQRLPKVRQEKDESCCRKLDIPDVRYSTFQVAEIDKTLLINQLGKIVSCHENMFEDVFNVDIVSGGGVYNGKLHVVSGFTWRIGVGKGSSSLLVKLYLDDVEDKSITSCDVDVTYKVINKTDDRQSVVKQYNETVRPGGYTCYTGLINWNRLSNPVSGFIDDHRNFTIQVTINKINVNN
ncbi:E3 ubiquitin-protein ligase TRIM33-like [Patella vulgata]|uniref:E3 ubiquitin-protein ligase TRIM33-like n=1 Tax=Patella vulgata TaxID=6465 RepID=UPI0024A87107|nr:E3 ubiquitin-protein ligase TRIM33-like [Patella vulgata]